MITAVAVETIQAGGAVARCIVGKLETEDGMTLLMTIGNEQGYDIFKRVPLPFVGQLHLQGLDPEGKAYVQNVSIPDGAVNVTIRVGGTQVNPQDILLPAVVPFV